MEFLISSFYSVYICFIIFHILKYVILPEPKVPCDVILNGTRKEKVEIPSTPCFLLSPSLFLFTFLNDVIFYFGLCIKAQLKTL